MEGFAHERSPEHCAGLNTRCMAAGHVVRRITHEYSAISGHLHTFECFQHGLGVWLRVLDVIRPDQDFEEPLITAQCQSPFEPPVHLAGDNAQAIPRSV